MAISSLNYTSYCIPLRPGTKEVFLDTNTNQRLSLEVHEIDAQRVEIRMQQPNGKSGTIRVLTQPAVTNAPWWCHT